MATAGTITWDLVANSSKFVTDLEKANKAGKNWGDKLGKAAKGVATTFAAAGAAAAASLAALYTVTAGNIDEQAKFADKIGVSTDALGGLHHAADLTGVSTENMNLGLQRMTRRVAEAAQGTGTAVDALDALNLSAEDLNQLSPDEQFLAIADAMGEVEGRSEQVRLAFKLFDSGGVALLNTMDMASDGIREAMEQAENLGIALNRVDAAQVENANDAFDVMTKVSSGISRQLTVAFAPAVEAVSNKVTELALETEWVGEVGTTVFNAVVKGAGYAANAFYFVSMGVLGLRAGFMELAAIAAESMTDSAQTVTKVLNATVGNVGKLIKWITDQLSSLVSMGEKLPGQAGEWARNVSGVLEELGKKVNEKLQFDEEGVVEGIEAIREAADDAYKDFENLANQELPSEQIEKIVEEWQSLSRAEAEAAANAKIYNEVVNEIGSNSGVDETVSIWERLKEHIEETTNDFDSMWGNTFDRFTSRFGDAVADAIVEGEGFNEAMQQIAVSFSKTMIAAMTEIATRQAVLWLLDKTILKSGAENESKRTVADANAKVEMASLNAFNSTAAIPIYGPAAAPAAAATARTLALPMATAAIAAANSGVAGIAHEGLDNIPERGTWLLDRGERVLSARQNEDLKQFLNQKQSGDVIKQEINSTLVVEAGARQDKDLAFARAVSDDLYNKLIEDAKTNGPLRRAMMR